MWAGVASLAERVISSGMASSLPGRHSGRHALGLLGVAEVKGQLLHLRRDGVQLPSHGGCVSSAAMCRFSRCAHCSVVRTMLTKRLRAASRSSAALPRGRRPQPRTWRRGAGRHRPARGDRWGAGSPGRQTRSSGGLGTARADPAQVRPGTPWSSSLTPPINSYRSHHAQLSRHWRSGTGISERISVRSRGVTGACGLQRGARRNGRASLTRRSQHTAADPSLAERGATRGGTSGR